MAVIDTKEKNSMTKSIYDIPVETIDHSEKSMGDYKNKVLLIVNVASECGFTQQYEGLEKLYKKYKSKGFEVLGFPSNQFGGQEPGTDEEIKQFCQSKFHVDFPMFSKIDVKGSDQHPLYKYLTNVKSTPAMNPDSHFKKNLNGDVAKSPDIMWNFEKFLVGPSGEVVGRFAPDVKPEDPLLTKAIEAELNQN
jgi:glutathione peroxidase